MITERIAKMQEIAKVRGKVPAIRPHFKRDYNAAALGEYKDLPHAEKLARAMAFAIVNQPIHAYEGDRIGGRIYYDRELPVIEECPELDSRSEAHRRFLEEFEDGADMLECQLITQNTPGHICWFYDKILRYGVEGFRKKFEEALSAAKDKEAEEFYTGVIIMLDALLEFNDKHISEYEKLGNTELVEIMKKVTGIKRTIVKVPGSLLMTVASIVGPLGGKALGICPARVKKLMISTNICGKKLADSGYKFHYTFEEAIKDWYRDNDNKYLR